MIKPTWICIGNTINNIEEKLSPCYTTRFEDVLEVKI